MASRLREAILNDPDQAKRIAFAREFGEAGDEADDPWAPPVSEYDLHADLLRELIHSVRAMLAIWGGSPGAPIPAPRTEVDRQAERLAHYLAARAGARWGFDESDYA